MCNSVPQQKSSLNAMRFKDLRAQSINKGLAENRTEIITILGDKQNSIANHSVQKPNFEVGRSFVVQLFSCTHNL